MEREIGDGGVRASLVIPVPEAEALVGRFRSAYDPGASKGMPAHITINYPFIPGVLLSADTIDRLTKVYASIQPFPFSLSHIARFPNVLYLAPSPSAPFEQLTILTAHEFPESPPYGGQYDSVTPHLTVADSKDGELPASVEREFSEMATEYLPLKAHADSVWLMDDSTGRWEKRMSFSLGANSQHT